MPINQLKTVRVLFSGKVQGVSFRVTAQMHASALDINGSVRNLPNGKVELLAQGKEIILEEFLKRLNNESLPIVVDHMDKKYIDIDQHFTDFKILH